MCLFFSRKTGFLAKAISNMLSTKIFFSSSCGKLISFNKLKLQNAWQTHQVAATYSASHTKRVTIVRFFDIQVKDVSHVEYKANGTLAIIHISVLITIVVSNKLVIMRNRIV